MEKKKVNKTVIALVVLLITSLTLMGCQSIMNKIEDRTLRENTVKMISALMNDNISVAYDLVSDSTDYDDFKSSYKYMAAFFGTVKTYDFVLLSAYRGYTVDNGESCAYSTASYKLDTNVGTYIVEVSSLSTREGIVGFYVAPFEKTDFYAVGDITNMRGANWFQWTMLLSNVLIILIAIIAFIDCCAHKVKLKALWLILIALGFFTVGATVASDSFKLLFNAAWLFSYTSYVTYGGGTERLRVLIPIGLIVYLCARKAVVKKREVPQTVYPEGDDIYALFRPEPDEPTPTNDGTEAGAQPEKPIGEGEKEDKENGL